MYYNNSLPNLPKHSYTYNNLYLDSFYLLFLYSVLGIFLVIKILKMIFKSKYKYFGGIILLSIFYLPVLDIGNISKILGGKFLFKIDFNFPSISIFSFIED